MHECWWCGRDRARCRSKRSYDTIADVDAAVAEVNALRNWAAGRTVTRYPCVWCPAWHVKTARTPVELRRVERQRRKSLVAAARG
jgi:hypothetical protein